MLGALVQAEKMVQIAFILPCAAFIGWLGGDWVAHRMGQKWPIVAGVIFGAAAGLVSAIRLALNTLNDPSVQSDESPQKENDENR